MNSMGLRIVCGGLLLGLLGGCTQVSFQNPPEPLRACDERLIGHWEARSEDPEPGERVYLRIEAACERWLALELDGEGPPKVEDLAATHQLRFADLGTTGEPAGEDSPVTGYLVVTEIRTAADAEEAAGESASPDEPRGHVLLRYAQVGQELRIWEIDARQVAHRIIDNEVPGWVDKRDRKPDASGNLLDRRFRVHVFADAAATRLLLSDAGIWEDEPWLQLRRVSGAEELGALQHWFEIAQPTSAR